MVERNVHGRPLTGTNFLVDLGYGDPQAPAGGFCEVTFPRFLIDAQQTAPAEAPRAPAPEDPGATHLILKRGVTGQRDLYAWWDKARKGKAPRQRTVKVQLLSEDHSCVVLTWYFRNARPVCLTYSALNALESKVLMETVEIAFDRMELR